MPFYLNHRATLQCAHGGQVMLIPPPFRSFHPMGSPVITDFDLMNAVIVGCPQIGPGLKPCTKITAILMGRSFLFTVDGYAPLLDTLMALTDGVAPGVVTALNHGGSNAMPNPSARQALTLSSAAANGKPFCEECARKARLRDAALAASSPFVAPTPGAGAPAAKTAPAAKAEPAAKSGAETSDAETSNAEKRDPPPAKPAVATAKAAASAPAAATPSSEPPLFTDGDFAALAQALDVETSPFTADGALLQDLVVHEQSGDVRRDMAADPDMPTLPGRAGRTPSGAAVNPNPGHQSAHLLPQSTVRDVPGVDAGQMVTRLLDTGRGRRHTVFDQHWQRSFRAIRDADPSATTVPAEVVYEVVRDAAFNSGAFSREEAMSTSALLYEQMFVTEGFDRDTPLRLPGRPR